MKVRVSWKDPAAKTMLQYTFDEDLEWEHFHRAFKRGETRMKEVAHPVNVILNFEKTTVVPAGGLQNLAKIYQEKAAKPENMNKTVIVGANGLLFVLLGVVRNMHMRGAADVMSAKTMDEASELLDSSASASG